MTPRSVEAITDAVAAAVRARTGVDPRIETGSIEAADRALSAAAAAPLVVAVGGDGTIRQVAAALSGRTASLAVVPGGTGNVLAGSLGITGVRPALEAIRHGQPRTIDLGEARWGRPGATDPDGGHHLPRRVWHGPRRRIMAAAEHEWKRRMRFGAYVGAALRELTRLRPAEFPHRRRRRAHRDARLPGPRRERRRARPGPDRPATAHRPDGRPARPDRPRRWQPHRRAPRGRATDARDAARRTRASSGAPSSTVRIEADPSQPIETDGDDHPPGWLEARVLPAALAVLGRPR